MPVSNPAALPPAPVPTPALDRTTPLPDLCRAEPVLGRLLRSLRLACVPALAALLASCALPPARTPPPAPVPEPVQPAPWPPAPGTPPSTVPPATLPPAGRLPLSSDARTPREYRRDAALHLYARNAQRIYKGMLQPHLYAIGVLDVDIDRNGQVTGIHWQRAPRHAPEVMAEIVRTVRAAAPFPLPARMGRVTYTDVWLWDKSGQFQLDTLTEGQL